MIARAVFALSAWACLGTAWAAPARDGLPDPSFGGTGVVYINTLLSGTTAWDSISDLVEQPDGRVLVVGSVRDTVSQFRSPALARLRLDGSLDTSFGVGGVARLTTAQVPMANGGQANAAGLLGDGRIVVVGSLYAGSGAASFLTCRLIYALSANGRLDTSYGTAPGPGCVVFGDPETGTRNHPDGAITVVQNDRVLIPAWRFNEGAFEDLIVGLNANGQLDGFFAQGGFFFGDNFRHFAPSGRLATAADGDEAVIVLGQRTDALGHFGGFRAFNLGGVDSTFGDAGYAFAPFTELPAESSIVSLARDGAGRWLVGGKVLINPVPNPNVLCDVCVARINADGTLDNTFNASNQHPGGPGIARVQEVNGGTVVKIMITPDQRIKIAAVANSPSGSGSGRDFTMYALQGNGAFDLRFGDVASPGKLFLNVGGDTAADDLLTAASLATGNKALLAGNRLGTGGGWVVVRLMDDLVFANGFE